MPWSGSAPSRLALLLAAALAALPASSGQRPSEASIVVDGALGDWERVVTNPLNHATDGDGSSVTCALSKDRDCRVDKDEHDLEAFTWTWDDQAFHLRFDRFGLGGTKHFHVLLDTDFDGLLSSGEPVVRVRLNDAADNDVELLRYVESAAPGDPLTDAFGFADGHRVPGSLGPPSELLSVDQGATPEPYSFEASIPWDRLGVPPRSPMLFRVTLGSGDKVPDDVRDAMGTEGGGVGTTAFRLVSVEPDQVDSSGPGLTSRSPFRVCNEGNVPSLVDLRVSSSLGADVVIRRDEDGDGFPDTYLGTDASGDGSFASGGDDLAPAGDTDADGALDAGLLGMAQCVDLILEETHPSNANGEIERLQLTARRRDAAAVAATATATLHLGRLSLRADAARLAAPGGEAWISHVLQSNQDTGETVNLEGVSALGWNHDLWADPVGAGDPADAVPLSDGDGDGLPDLWLPAGGLAHLFLRCAVPPAAPFGQVESVQLTARINGAARSSVSDRLTVVEPLVLGPDHLLSEGREKYGPAGGVVWFPHVLTNAQARVDAFSLTAVSDAGWTVEVLDDPDADGRPYDARPFPGFTPPLAANGGRHAVLVRLVLPDGAAASTSSRVSVVAASASDPANTVTATDDAVVALVQLYDDPTFATNVQVVPPCSTVHGRATGLLPADPDHRFVWRDSAGDVVQAVAVSTDATGEAVDTLVLAPGLGGSGWSLSVDRWDADSGAWAVQDTARFDVVGQARVSSLEPALEAVHFAAARVAGTAEVLNSSADTALADVQLRWVVRDPASATYLLADGTFAAYTGTEATRTDAIPSLAPGASELRSLVVADVDFPEPGTWLVELFLDDACGGSLSAASATRQVVDDADGDGLSAGQESAAGLDPQDSDSDDDGLSDGDDGVADSDGDGLIDALDCDSDDDGVGDGVEAGLFSAGPDTDLASGCYRADLWPGTTTDPDDPDTDAGGLPDGAEDFDGNGRVDPGEGDPLDPSDDGSLDRDLDGVPDLAERSAGTDPLDADTDDDGLEDGLEWGRDSDGDGRVDALSCDSDGDGLADGLEAGVATPGPDTELAAGCFVADADPSTSTDPTSPDTDDGGVPDGAEDANRNGRVDPAETDPGDGGDEDPDGDGLTNMAEASLGTDPRDSDSDSDGVGDGLEAAAGTDPTDGDSDDDGLGDGLEWGRDSDGDGVPDPLACDSDGDSLPDGLEAGVSVPGADTDAAAGCFRADDDPATTTDPTRADTDAGGVMDGAEDADGNGRVDAGETDPVDGLDEDPDGDGLTNGTEALRGTDPRRADSDSDGLGDGGEVAAGTDPLDLDSDDDGLADGSEWGRDSDADGIIDALACDSDGDGLPDGLESGVAEPPSGTEVSAGCFRADLDPATTTDPTRADTDGGGLSDGAEDLDADGRVGPGERDPAFGTDDGCELAPPAELSDLRGRRTAGGDVLWTWTAAPLDVCSSYTLLAGSAADEFTVLAEGLAAPEHAPGAAGGTGGIRYVLVRVDSSLAGAGATGRAP